MVTEVAQLKLSLNTISALLGALAGAAAVAAAALALGLARGGVPVDELHFPDPALRAWAAEVADADADGRITEVEARKVVVVEAERVADLTGLDNFADVEELRLNDSELAQAEISGYRSLRVVDLSGSEGLGSVTLADLPALEEVDLAGTAVTDVFFKGDAGSANLEAPDGARVHYQDGTVEEVRTDPLPAYAERLGEYVGEYGQPSVRAVWNSDGYLCSAEGVCLAELVDFDADGTEELLVVYYDSGVANDYLTDIYGNERRNDLNDGNAYVAEVWAFAEGEVEVVYKQPVQATNGGWAYLNRLSFSDGKSWLRSEDYDGSHFIKLWEIGQQGSDVVHYYELRGEFTDDLTFWIDGAEESEGIDEWDDNYGASSLTYLLINRENADDKHVEVNGEGYSRRTVHGCIELARETMLKLGMSEIEITPPDEKEANALDSDAYCREIESQSKGPVINDIMDDFDGDGLVEAFVITGTFDDIAFVEDCEVWFVNNDGAIELMSDGEFGGSMLRVVAGDTVRSKGYQFVTLIDNVKGENTARVYGVKDGIPQEMSFDMDRVGILAHAGSTGSSEDLEAFVNADESGYMVYGVELDEESFTFKSTGFKRGPVRAG